MKAPINQCDGCQAGIPLINGSHRMGEEGGYSNPMRCTKHLYLYEGEEEAIYEYYKGVIRAAFAARGGADK